jgi:hypothetical protein
MSQSTASNYLIRPFWMDDESDVDELRQLLISLPELIEKYKHHPLMDEFKKQKAISMIYCSNKLESTIPIDINETESHQILEQLVFGGERAANDDLASGTWISDGEIGISFYRQLYHHVSAYQYVCGRDTPLTVDLILSTHRKLMRNAVHNGKAISLFTTSLELGWSNAIQYCK